MAWRRIDDKPLVKARYSSDVHMGTATRNVKLSASSVTHSVPSVKRVLEISKYIDVASDMNGRCPLLFLLSLT